MAAITGSRPHGVTLSIAYNPDGVDDFDSYLDPKADLAYTQFIRRFVGQSLIRLLRSTLHFFFIGFVITFSAPAHRKLIGILSHSSSFCLMVRN